jgi:hypothetical protein
MRRESEPFTDRSPITVAGSASVRHYPPMSYQGRDRRWCRWVLRRQNGWLPEKDSPNPTLPCRPRGGKSRSEREPAHEMSGPSRGTDGSNPVPSSRQSVSLRNSPPLVRKLPFSAGVRAGAGGAVGRDAQRPANIRSTDGIISGGPYSSTAMPPDVVRNSAGTGPHARPGCLVA